MRAEKNISAVSFAIIVASSSRFRSRGNTAVTDESGDTAEEMIRRASYPVVSREIVDDSVAQIRYATLKALMEKKCDVCIVVGGTGVSPRDVTPEALRPLLEKELPGFGELFRAVSQKDVGDAATLSRALAGSVEDKLIVALPGSPQAVRAGIELLLRNVKHILQILRQQ